MQEEENSRLTTAKRRLQREIDELTEQNETLQRDLTNAKKRYGKDLCFFHDLMFGVLDIIVVVYKKKLFVFINLTILTLVVVGVALGYHQE